MTVRTYLNNSPLIAKTTYIDPMALVIGQVQIGEDSSVWPFACIRGDVHHITIGNRTSIQDGCVLHVTHDGPYTPGGRALLIGNDVTVGHKVILHACTVEDRCIIGMGATILDGALVQSEVIVGAGSLVPPGKILESGYLWLGTPVIKKRPLTDAEKVFILYSAGSYVTLKNNYLHSLTL